MYSIVVLFLTFVILSSGTSSDSCRQYQSCDDCLNHEECGWVVPHSSPSNAGCLQRSAQTCPPEHLWYLDACPCDDCFVIELALLCNVQGETYTEGYHCSIGEDGECSGAFLPPCCCIEDGDCPSDTHYCLHDWNGPSTSGFCTPYEQVGGSCGGFTMPGFQRQCDPSLTCVYDLMIADAPGTCQDPCSLIDCPGGEECVLVDVVCITAPCPPVAECKVSGGEEDPCNLIDCPDGEECVLVDVQCIQAPCPPVAQCQVPGGEDPCSLIDCPDGEECVLVDVVCITAPCPPVAECKVPGGEDPCSLKKCADGEECVLVDVQCIQAPCPPVAECQPVNSKN